MKKLNRYDAAAAVNESFRAAKVTEAVKDPKAKGFIYSFGGESRSHTFAHKHTSHEQRKDEIAKLRVSLVEELLGATPVADVPPPEEAVEPKAQA